MPKYISSIPPKFFLLHHHLASTCIDKAIHLLDHDDSTFSQLSISCRWVKLCNSTKAEKFTIFCIWIMKVDPYIVTTCVSGKFFGGVASRCIVNQWSKEHLFVIVGIRLHTSNQSYPPLGESFSEASGQSWCSSWRAKLKNEIRCPFNHWTWKISVLKFHIQRSCFLCGVCTL